MADISSLFSDKQIDEFQEAFTLYDSNKDGTVFMHQVEGVMKALGIHANESNMALLKVILHLRCIVTSSVPNLSTFCCRG